MGPNRAVVKLILRRGGRPYWVIVGGLTATLCLLQLAKAAHHSSDLSASAPAVYSHELDSLVQSLLERGVPCPEAMGEDQVAGRDPLLGLVAPQVIGLDPPPSASCVATDGSNPAGSSTALKPVPPDCASNCAGGSGAADDGTSAGPRCARPAPTLRRFDSKQVADARHLRAR